MVRSRAPLIERMTLSWHDWFATSNEGVDSQRLMIAQNRTQRALCLASFPRMLTAMTTDPAMLLWLSGSGSTKEAPNENYAREMQELFTLGVGDGYTERDVREHARALTGWTNTWNQATGEPEDFHFEAKLHDDGVKTIYGQRGRFGWRDSVRLVLDHPDHPGYFVTKLWSYFCPSRCRAATRSRAEHLYRLERQADPAGRRGDADAPADLRRPAHGQAADRADRGDAARDRALHRHRRLGVGVEPRRARCPSTRPTSPAGKPNAG